MGLPAQGQNKDDGKKRFCCRSFPYAVSKMGVGVGGMFLPHQLDDISNHQEFMRHRMRLKRKEGLDPCSGDGRQMEDDTGA